MSACYLSIFCGHVLTIGLKTVQVTVGMLVHVHVKRCKGETLAYNKV